MFCLAANSMGCLNLQLSPLLQKPCLSNWKQFWLGWRNWQLRSFGQDPSLLWDWQVLTGWFEEHCDFLLQNPMSSKWHFLGSLQVFAESSWLFVFSIISAAWFFIILRQVFTFSISDTFLLRYSSTMKYITIFGLLIPHQIVEGTFLHFAVAYWDLFRSELLHHHKYHF